MLKLKTACIFDTVLPNTTLKTQEKTKCVLKIDRP